MDKIFHVELQTPKRSSEDIEKDLQTFADKYRKVIEAGWTVCITDNPMGLLSYGAMETIELLGLPVPPGQLMVHLNTFHPRAEIDAILEAFAAAGGSHLLVVSGDGSQRLHRLEPAEVGIDCQTVTSVELLRYIDREHKGRFTCGVAFNPYEPQDAEIEKMKRKVGAGASFIITQPVLGRDDRLDGLVPFGLPVVLDAWMSKKLHLLSECVGHEIPEGTPYDPMENLRELRRNYPDYGLYLAILGFKTQYPLLQGLWT
ncbi:MAG TPA: methylenetetrahydrofolate reductase [Candidatus Aminicenantes bacterium]|nr:methylenetetrahydrofolate reductase [Candidatus Aminicenantes bacterium]HRY64833.1 methylenetetrahydrofolate reductase [Candidatus Aminicenantes bacterium]HRZ71746.1 methylenetetrahydrofolate reductase [Candidatus Aminicenantes bacterium]